MKYIPITINGINKLKKELEFLKEYRRPKIIKYIIEARKYGDIKENSEYHAAKEEQILCEKRIKEIEIKLLNAKVIDISSIIKKNFVVFGSIVEIKNLDNNYIEKYCLVSEEELDIKNNKISIYSPIGKSLIGKKINDIVSISVPKGIINYKVIDIKYI